MYLVIVYIIHVALCITKSKFNTLSGVILILFGIIYIEYGYYMRHINGYVYLFWLLLGIIYIILVIKMANLIKIKSILQSFGQSKRNLRDINFLLIICEEYIFRVILTYIFEVILVKSIPLIIHIIIMGLIFTMVHKFESLMQRLEFLLFSILMSLCFLNTRNLILISLIHLSRNLSINNVTKYIEITEAANGIN